MTDDPRELGRHQPPGTCVVYLRDGRAIDVTGITCAGLVEALRGISRDDIIATVHKLAVTVPVLR